MHFTISKCQIIQLGKRSVQKCVCVWEGGCFCVSRGCDSEKDLLNVIFGCVNRGLSSRHREVYSVFDTG